ncbi:MAG: helix-turn-helix transcriptional regulator [Limisphaerales bacterium]
MFAFQELFCQNAFSENMIINTVTEWRMKKGVTKAHMARQIGVERSYMSKLEQGHLQPSSGKMLRIAEYLKQPVEVLFLRQK